MNNLKENPPNLMAPQAEIGPLDQFVNPSLDQLFQPLVPYPLHNQLPEDQVPTKNLMPVPYEAPQAEIGPLDQFVNPSLDQLFQPLVPYPLHNQLPEDQVPTKNLMPAPYEAPQAEIGPLDQFVNPSLDQLFQPLVPYPLHNQLPEDQVPTKNLMPAPYEAQEAPKKRRRVKRNTDIGKKTDIEKKKIRARREKNRRDNKLNEIYTMTERRLSSDDQKRFKELYSTTRKFQISDIEELNKIKSKLNISSDDIRTPQVDQDVKRNHGENDNEYKERKRKIISTRESQARRNAEYNKLKQLDEKLDELLSWENNRNDNDHRRIIEQPLVQPDNQQQQLIPMGGIIFPASPHWTQEAINMPANEQQTVAPTGQLFSFAGWNYGTEPYGI